MPIATPSAHQHRAFFGLCTAILLIVVLRLGKEVIMPLALAALLAFMLSPLVRWSCRLGLNRTISVTVVTLLTFTVLTVVAWLLGQQVASLAGELPSYQQNINRRIASIQNLGEQGLIAKMRQFGEDLSDGVLSGSAPAPAPAPRAPDPPKMEGLAAKALNGILTALAGGLGAAGVVVVFVIFMLLRQEDLSQRIVRLAGFNRLTTTTRALDEVGERVSHYLLMQGTVNGLYGLLLASGLALIGMPYVVLWGALAALFRYIPYIGPIIVAFLPVTFSLAIFDGWAQPLAVIGLIAVLELSTNMFLEPILYGRSTGVSDLSLLVAIAFWTWLWGGIGLVLATPMTVCLVVFCKYIPSLEWVDVLMGDKPAPQAHLTFYQQLLSEDGDVARHTIEESLEKQGVDATLESILIPALVLTRRETVLGKLLPEEQNGIHQSFDLCLQLVHEFKTANAPMPPAGGPDLPAPPTPPALAVFARALHGNADALALKLLAAGLPENITLDISSEPHLIGELVQELEEKKPDLLCLSAMPPDSEMAASGLCRRLHNRLPNLKILVCRWALPGQIIDTRPLREVGASWVVTSFEDARGVIQRSVEK